MANTRYTDLLQYVLPEVAGCSSLLAEMEIRAAVIDLCRRAKIWTHEDDPTVTMALARTYDLNAPNGAAIIEIKSMWCGGFPVDPTDDDDDASVTGMPETYRQISPEVFALWPTPNGEYEITMELTLAPARASTSFPAWIAERYHNAIVAGAKSRLMLMAGNPWANVQTALFYRSMFETEVATAHSDSTTGFARTRLRTTSQH